MMYLNKNLVDCVRLDCNQVALPGYLGFNKRELQKKHAALLEQTTGEPEFLVANQPSRDGPGEQENLPHWMDDFTAS
jgi:hypothetical protein